MSIRFLNNGSKSSAKLNIFMQETEPDIKNGIWLQSNKSFDKIISANNIYNEPYWNYDEMSSLKPIPYNVDKARGVLLDTNVYFFGGNSGTDGNHGYNYYSSYKYNLKTDTYTGLAQPLKRCSESVIIPYNNEIYIFGSSESSWGKNAYKYNTFSNNYTSLKDIPYEFGAGSGVLYKDNIYLFGGNGGKNNAYLYNIRNNNYSSLNNIPYDFCSGCCVEINGNIYLLGGEVNTVMDYSKYNYKYNIATNTYARVSDIPFSFNYGSAISVGNNIFLFGGNSSKKTACVYNTVTDTYQNIQNIPNDFSNGFAIYNESKLYLFSQKKVQIMELPLKNFEHNSIVIDESSSNYETEIITTDVENGLHYKFKDIFFNTENGFDNTIPTYYGDGTQWIKFKN